LDVEDAFSLADAVGFVKASEKLGKVARTKTIREGVVAVPFVEKENQRQFFDIDITDDAQSSVQQMLTSMQNYVFPPSMDFINYSDDVSPFAMYIFEFENELNQQDLVDIWQNLPPRIGRAFDEEAPVSSAEIMQEKQITHSLACGELLENVDAKLQWMVFKVKQRAQTNYWRKTVTNNPEVVPVSEVVDSGGASSIIASAAKTTDFINGGAGKGAVEKVGEFKRTYNWPYDYFSLVELVKIDEEVTFTPNYDAIDSGAVVDQNQLLGSAITQPATLAQQGIQESAAPSAVDKAQKVGSALTPQGVQKTTGVSRGSIETQPAKSKLK